MASKARRRPAEAPGLTAHQTEGLLAYEQIRDGLAKLESLPRGNQQDTLAWARGIYPAEARVWDAIEKWLED